MIIFHADRQISADQAAHLRHLWQRSLDTAAPFILPLGWRIEQIAIPTMAGPLVEYLEQLGDA